MSKRNSAERRSFGNKVTFPLQDNSGCVVPFNRSRQPDRRLNNYLLKEIGGAEFLNQYRASRRR